ncbi:MAG: CopG family transcriptional regulator [Acidimicrobiales bacterium]
MARASTRGTRTQAGSGSKAKDTANRYKKLTINLAPAVHGELHRLADERGVTISELIRRAIALDLFLHEHRDSELLLKRGDDIRQIVLV